jgi:hypothetical protein
LPAAIQLAPGRRHLAITYGIYIYSLSWAVLLAVIAANTVFYVPDHRFLILFVKTDDIHGAGINTNSTTVAFNDIYGFNSHDLGLLSISIL